MKKTGERTDVRAMTGAKINRGRFILHSDLNNFFASVECALNPQLRGHPVAVCGDVEARHGIILAKNYLAKEYGVKTAQTVVEAKKLCPVLVLVSANYENYAKYSALAKKIYADYTDKVEPFGADEAWLDISGSARSFDDAEKIADEIRNRIFTELGLTASVGVSYNKIFAKLASDYKKPDATTVFSPAEYASKIAPLAVSEMIFVGRSTTATLARYGIHTIGALASCSEAFAKSILGKNGVMHYHNARGEDTSPVSEITYKREIKSIGNSTTPPRDLKNNADVKAMCFCLAESVGARLRAHGLRCNTVQITIRESNLKTHEHQIRLDNPTSSTVEIATIAYSLFESIYDWHIPVRSIGVRATGLESRYTPRQVSIFDEKIDERERKDKIDSTLDTIRDRYGYESLLRGAVICDRALTGVDIKSEMKLRSAFAQH